MSPRGMPFQPGPGRRILNSKELTKFQPIRSKVLSHFQAIQHTRKNKSSFPAFMFECKPNNWPIKFQHAFLFWSFSIPKKKGKSPVTSPLESRCQSASRSSSQFTTESFQSFSISCHATRQLPGILYRQKKLGHVQINKNEGEKYNYVPLLFISPILPSDYENHANLILPSPGC